MAGVHAPETALKIALVSDWYYPRVGGIEYAIDALARRLAARGHAVHILTRRYDGTSGYELNDGIPTIRLAGNRLSEHLPSRSGYRGLTTALHQGGYDCIHAHGLDSPLAMASLAIARRLDLPSVMTCHSLIGHGALRAPLKAAAARVLSKALAIIAVSRAVAEEARRMYSGLVVRIPNGIDTVSPNGPLDSIAIPEGAGTVIAAVARMTKRKGVADLIAVACQLLKRHRDLLFLMVGEGPLKAALQGRVHSLGIARHFLFTGGVSRATVLQLLEHADIFVSPSPREAFGISVLEAFLKGVPVVARSGTGSDDLIHHEYTGLLACDLDGMVHCIERLIGAPGLRAALAASAYDELAHYRWDVIAERVEAVYTQVIDRNRRARG